MSSSAARTRLRSSSDASTSKATEVVPILRSLPVVASESLQGNEVRPRRNTDREVRQDSDRLGVSDHLALDA